MLSKEKAKIFQFFYFVALTQLVFLSLPVEKYRKNSHFVYTSRHYYGTIKVQSYNCCHVILYNTNYQILDIFLKGLNQNGKTLFIYRLRIPQQSP